MHEYKPNDEELIIVDLSIKLLQNQVILVPCNLLTRELTKTVNKVKYGVGYFQPDD